MLTLILVGCVSTGFERGVERVRQMWLTDSSRVYRDQGSRSVALDKTQVRQAARFALERIGLTVTRDDPSTGVVEAVRALTPTDISGAVREAELPRVQRIMAEEMGPAGASLPLGLGEGALLVATASVAGIDDRSTVEIRTCNGGRDHTGAYSVGRCVIPTAQLRAGLNEFWRAFYQESAEIEALQTGSASRAQPMTQSVPSGPVRPPSGWVLPD